MVEKKGSKGGGSRVGLPDFATGRLSRLKYKLVCHFNLVVDMVKDGIKECVNDIDGPAFLERELMGLGMDGY
jgi:hypothetical protein